MSKAQSSAAGHFFYHALQTHRTLVSQSSDTDVVSESIKSCFLLGEERIFTNIQ
jgi:hypothetical protein